MKKDTKPFVQRPVNTPKKEAWYIRIIKSLWFWLLIIFAIIGFSVDLPTAWDKYTNTPLEQAQKEKWIPGILLPEAIRNQEWLMIKLGTNSFNFQLPQDRATAQELDFSVTHCPVANIKKVQYKPGDPLLNCFSGLRFKIENNRLFVSDTIRDIRNDDILGYLNFNKYDIARGDYGDPHADDQHLEILDKAGNVALSVGFTEANEVYINGYFILHSTISVVGGEHGIASCLYRENPHDMDYVKKEIATIKPRYNYH